MGCCCAIRREFLNFCMPIPAGIAGHDNWLVAFWDGLDANVVEETPLQYYRCHESNESQFIANRTTKFTRPYSLLSTLKSVRNSDAILQVSASRNQLGLIVEGIEKAKKVAGASRQQALDKFMASTQARLAVLERRVSVRQKALVLRIRSAIRLYSNGGYQEASGLKSMVRDIVR